MSAGSEYPADSRKYITISMPLTMISVLDGAVNSARQSGAKSSKSDLILSALIGHFSQTEIPKPLRQTEIPKTLSQSEISDRAMQRKLRAVELFDLGYSCEDISLELGVSVSSINQYLQDASRRLKPGREAFEIVGSSIDDNSSITFEILVESGTQKGLTFNQIILIPSKSFEHLCRACETDVFTSHNDFIGFKIITKPYNASLIFDKNIRLLSKPSKKSSRKFWKFWAKQQ